MIAKYFTFEHPDGLHLRVAAEIVKLAQTTSSRVRLVRGDDMREANAISIMDLLLLEATAGTDFHVEVDGPNEQQVLNRIEEIFGDGGGI